MAYQNSIQETAEMAQRALPASIDSLNFSVNNLESALSSLHSQLSQLLDPANVLSCEGEGKVAPVTLPYSSEINNLASRIRSATDLINEIRERLHV